MLHDGKQIAVGAGLTEDERRLYWDDRMYFLGKVAEVSFQETTQSGNLRHATFVRMRPDKASE